jgi:hypothetical protein
MKPGFAIQYRPAERSRSIKPEKDKRMRPDMVVMKLELAMKQIHLPGKRKER